MGAVNSMKESENMIRTATMIGLSALALSAVPALAASPALTAGAAAYAEGDASDVRPSEQSDFAYCAGYWDAWSNAANDGTVPEEALESLAAELVPPSTSLAAITMFVMLDDEEAMKPQIDAAGAEAGQLIAGTLAGDVEAAESLFRSLGTCQVEDE